MTLECRQCPLVAPLNEVFLSSLLYGPASSLEFLHQVFPTCRSDQAERRTAMRECKNVLFCNEGVNGPTKI